MSQKDFPPTELRIQRLRDEGVVPFSSEMSSLFAVLAIALLISLARFYLLATPGRVTNFAATYFAWESAEASIGMGEAAIIVGCVLLLSLGVLAVVLLGGLLQNRFLWATSALGKSLNLVSFDKFFGIRGRIGAIILRSITAIALFAIVFALIRVIVTDYFGAYQQIASDGNLQKDVSTLLALQLVSLVDYLMKALWGSVAILAAIAVVSRVVVVQSFRLQYSMTREEIEAEQRETEPSTEVRERQRTRD